MQIPILNGIYTQGSEIRTSYPVNLVPVAQDSGISKGYLRPADGIVSNGTGPGIDRGGINWRGVCYRVMGTKLVTVAQDGTVTTLGDVGGTVDQAVSFNYGFDRLAIASGGKLYYWNGALTQVTDPDIGNVLAVVWVDGYFMTTDGTSLVVTELNDPTQVNPLKYGSSEIDPDPVISLLKLRNEVFAVNRNTIEVFDNTGGSLFPFSRIEGAQIQKGAIGAAACCVYAESIAFLGGGRNEPPSIYIGRNAQADKISTPDIDKLLLEYSEGELSGVKLEAMDDRGRQLLYVHLPDRTLAYDLSTTQVVGEHVWFVLCSSYSTFNKYRARNMVWAYDKWLVGDPLSSNVGYLTQDVSSHWGETVRWEFGTLIAYNGGKGGIFNQLELVTLPGNDALGADPMISTSYSMDGKSWSQDRVIRSGKIGDTMKRIVWMRQGHMRNWRIQRFRGDSTAHLTFVRLEAQIEPMAF